MPNLHALELFAGIGGNSYAFKAAGIKTIGYCEIDPWAQAVLRSNMLRGRLHRAPIFPDVATFRCSQLSKKPDIISGGFPCLGLSLIGKKQGLLGDERSKLVLHVCRLVEEATPQYVFLENTPAIIRILLCVLRFHRKSAGGQRSPARGGSCSLQHRPSQGLCQ